MGAMATDFDAAAATWDTPEKIARTRRIADAIADQVPLDPAWRVLDYGCGTGLLAWSLAEHVAHVTLADTSDGMLEVARTGAARDPERFTVVRLDLTESPAPEPYDLIVSAMALHHIPETEAVLVAFRDALMPGGWVALADLDADPHNRFHDDDFDGHHGMDRHRIAALLRDLDFEKVHVSTAVRVKKDKHGVEHEHDVFLAVARKRE